MKKVQGGRMRLMRALAAADEKFRFLEEYDLEPLQYARGEALCMCGEPMRCLLFLVEGRAKISITTENGRTLLLAFTQGVQMLGDLELCLGLNTRTSVSAITSVSCLGVPMALCRTALMNDARFLRLISGELAKKLDECSFAYARNMLYPLSGRLAGYILNTEENGKFCEHLGALSEYLGTSYRHLQRVLSAFLEDGLLQREGAGYRIADRAALGALGAHIYG